MSGTGFDTSFPHFSQDPVADASCNAPVLSQAFRSTDLKATSECVAPYNYIDPAKALGSQSVASFGQSTISPTQNLPSAPADTRYSSCDEDAEGEPDESYTAELSFWSTELGDTSGSTATTFAPAEASFPFVESCSALGGGTLKRTVMHGDTPIELDLPCEADPTAESSRYAPAELQPVAASTNMAKISSIKKRRRSSPKRLTDYCTSSKANLYSAPAKNKAARSRTAASSSKAAANTRVADVSERQSPAMGSDSPGSGASGVSSPSTPSGKFKLRKKDEVPRRSLAALLTPPRDKRAGIFEDASQDARDWRKAATQEPALEVAADNGIAAGESAGLAHKSEADEMPEMVFADLEETEDVKPATFVDKGQRVFPAGWEIHSGFPLLYQRYDDELRDTVDRAQSVHGAFNKPRSILDLYTPRFVKGVGVDKVGMCPVCLQLPLAELSRRVCADGVAVYAAYRVPGSGAAACEAQGAQAADPGPLPRLRSVDRHAGSQADRPQGRRDLLVEACAVVPSKGMHARRNRRVLCREPVVSQGACRARDDRWLRQRDQQAPCWTQVTSAYDVTQT
ncbi:hypothetical protein L1887_58362 [Cichorium endivia]|nr:hypothetical protein L1887_58362 [Cichorium endivia]